MSRARPFSVRRLAACATSALLVACAGPAWAPTGVRPGDSEADVLRVMGPPTARHVMPDGHERLEYTRLPAGRQTFMIDLDAARRVARWENVLDENHFAAIEVGMSHEDVRRLLGPPTYTWHHARPVPAITWLYRFQTVQRCTLFEISFDQLTGRVLSTEYPPDPACPDEHW